MGIEVTKTDMTPLLTT